MQLLSYGHVNSASQGRYRLDFKALVILLHLLYRTHLIDRHYILSEGQAGDSDVLGNPV